MAIQPSPAGTHSGTPSAPEFARDIFGRITAEWVSPKGWTVTPAIWVADPDLSDPCACGDGLLSAVLTHPEHDPRLLCVSCFDRLMDKTFRRYGW